MPGSGAATAAAARYSAVAPSCRGGACGAALPSPTDGLRAAARAAVGVAATGARAPLPRAGVRPRRRRAGGPRGGRPDDHVAGCIRREMVGVPPAACTSVAHTAIGVIPPAAREDAVYCPVEQGVVRALLILRTFPKKPFKPHTIAPNGPPSSDSRARLQHLAPFLPENHDGEQL